MITSFDEDVEKMGPSYIASGIAKEYSHFGKHLAVCSGVKHRVTMWPNDSDP